MTTKKLIIRYLILLAYAIIIPLGRYIAIILNFGEFSDFGFGDDTEVILYFLVLPIVLIAYGAVSYKITHRLLIPTLILLGASFISECVMYIFEIEGSYTYFIDSLTSSLLYTFIAMTPITILVIMKKSEERSCRKKGKT